MCICQIIGPKATCALQGIQKHLLISLSTYINMQLCFKGVNASFIETIKALLFDN